MKKHRKPELETLFTEANKVNEGRAVLRGRTPVYCSPSRSSARHSLSYLRSLLFVLVVATAALPPAAAQAQAIQAWVQRYNGPGNLGDWPTAMALDTNGNVYVTGAADVGGSHYVTIKYSSAGVPLWTNYNAPGVAYALAVDAGDDVIVTGLGGADSLTIKYSSAGPPLWTNRYHGPGTVMEEIESQWTRMVTYL